MKIAYICPVYDALNLNAYTIRALESFFATTKDGIAIVVDDGSADWAKAVPALEQIKMVSGQQLIMHHYPEWGGLTRSWNKGLEIAEQLQVDYACPSNNDVLFTPGWYTGLVHALSHGYSLVGPLSNAPGHTSPVKASITTYVPDYVLTDSPEYLVSLAARLQANAGKIVQTRVNGFFQMAKMQDFISGKFDEEHFYRPINDYSSTKIKNKTPLMTLNEDELQRRWAKLKRKFAVSLSSFIFHYRAVSRGKEHKTKLSYRLKDT